MTLLVVLGCIVILVLLITWIRLNAFLAFLIVAILAALMLGIPAENVARSVKKGIGDMLGDLVIIITIGAMLGKLVAETGAAQKISEVLVNLFGSKNIQWAMAATGFIVGIPLFYNVGFVLLVPLAFSVVYQTRLPPVYVGLPMLAALSVTHGFLPPHPAPAALVTQFDADLGTTLIYGLAIAIPTVIVAGPLFARLLKNIKSVPLKTFKPAEIPRERMPGALNSFLSALLPVILLVITTLISWMIDTGSLDAGEYEGMVAFIGDPSIVMLVSLLIATISLGIMNGWKMGSLMEHYGEAVKDIALIVLVIAGAGALKQVFVDSGVSAVIGAYLQNIELNPLILGWLIAAIIRVCLGSATVAGLTAAGIIAPIILAGEVDPNLMVLAIGAGSLMFSHVNDAGFWMYKEYFNLSIKDTIKSWSVMETIVAVLGLGGVLILELILI